MVLTDDYSIFNTFSRLLILSCNIWVSGDDVLIELDVNIL